MKEAMFYTKAQEQAVNCHLCNHHCHIKLDKHGICGVRKNQDGTLWSLVYGKVITQHIDPIEKKPLYHFYPGTRSYSIATVGCNFRCTFCQNADISQSPREDRSIYGNTVAAESIVEQARKTGCASISYTYTEPTIFMEYALDVARLAYGVGIKNIFVSNGYMTEESLEAIAPYLDAANVDLKAFSDHFYAKQCGAHLEPVLKTLARMKELGIWLEVTTLLIPGLNDDPAELTEMVKFLSSLGPETPWHISRFHPAYRLMDRPVTPIRTLQNARDIGIKGGLQYVYLGNVPGDAGENTYCRQCRALLIERYGFTIQNRGLEGGKCATCGAVMAGIGTARLSRAR
jgi:pyruvate formate lyase activating enzyme